MVVSWEKAVAVYVLNVQWVAHHQTGAELVPIPSAGSIRFPAICEQQDFLSIGQQAKSSSRLL